MMRTFLQTNLDSLKKLVLTTVSYDSISPSDCKTLSIEIFKKTGQQLSDTTLKRIYGFAYSKFQPSLFTLDAMYLTRWYKAGDKTIHFIYLSKWQNNTWSEPVKLNINVNAEGFNSIQPFVTPDGKHLFFSSNKPGGRGGDDIWMSDLDADGNPTSSINLGSTINTPMDEQAPYYNVLKKKLTYSSKGFTGLGGFDFFESWYDGEKWSQPINMGYPCISCSRWKIFPEKPIQAR